MNQETLVRSQSSPTRCPYCHEGCGRDDERVCRGCLARHHAACWDEHGACASCGQAEALAPLPTPAPEAPPRVEATQAYVRALIASSRRRRWAYILRPRPLVRAFALSQLIAGALTFALLFGNPQIPWALLLTHAILLNAVVLAGHIALRAQRYDPARSRSGLVELKAGSPR